MRWDPDLLYQKAKLYLERANALDHESMEFPFWSSLALELLARAALTHLHPALNADPRQPDNLLYACGVETTKQPRSLPLHAVFLRLEKIIPDFGKTHRELCDYLSILRNDELHSGELPYVTLRESKWLPRFYEVCQILADFLEHDLEDLLGSDIADAAKRLVAAHKEEAAKAVRGRIHEHSEKFAKLTEDERQELSSLASVPTRIRPLNSSTASCPSCQSKAVMQGELIKEMKPRYEDDLLLIDSEYLATSLSCPACGLQLHSLEEIVHADLEPRFVVQRATELHEMFEPDYYVDDYMNM